MDIGYANMGAVEGDCSKDDVQAIAANARCHNCDGWGAFFPRVPFRWPWGLQGVSRGNATGKGKGKGGGKTGVKGGGRGGVAFKGSCFACGDT